MTSSGHTCDGGNRTLTWSQFCDGIFNCKDRFDEEGHFCKQCINNLYSCPPDDDLRCDLACDTLSYVPCQTIQDRRACQNLRHTYDKYSPYMLLKDFNFYLAVAIATLVILLVTTSIILLIKYLIRTHRRRTVRSSIKTLSLNLPAAPPPAYQTVPHSSNETDNLSSHIYEQCYEPPSYETAHKYPWTRTHYEHSF